MNPSTHPGGLLLSHPPFEEPAVKTPLRKILEIKGSNIHCMGPDATLQDVSDKLVEHGVGSLLICDDSNKLLGIITERDILRACAGRTDLAATGVSELMSTDLITMRPDQTVEDAMEAITDHRIRHLPILEGDRLCGIISIGDLIKSQIDAMATENHHLKQYIYGADPEVVDAAQ